MKNGTSEISTDYFIRSIAQNVQEIGKNYDFSDPFSHHLHFGKLWIHDVEVKVMDFYVLNKTILAVCESQIDERNILVKNFAYKITMKRFFQIEFTVDSKL